MEIKDCSQTDTKFLLSHFNNGILKINKTTDDHIKFSCFEETNTKNHPVGTNKSGKRLLVAEANGIRYAGTNQDLASSCDSRFKYMVGVLDRDHNKLRLYNADFFRLQPEYLDNSDDEEKPEKSFFEKNDELTTAFGSSRKRKAMASRHKNQLKESALQDSVGAAVDLALDAPDVDKLIAPTEVQKFANEIPPFNINGQTPQDVYSLDSILSNAELEVMGSVAQQFYSCKKETIDDWEIHKKYPCYVLNHLRVMPINEEPRLKRACLLLYVCYLIYMFKLSYKGLKLKDPFPVEWNVPALVKKSLLTRFTVTPEGSKQRMMTARLKDKLLSYLLVLCLIIDEFNMPYIDLVKDLKIMDKRLQTFFRALGCKILKRKLSGETVSTVTLPVPLVFPDIGKKVHGEKTRR